METETYIEISPNLNEVDDAFRVFTEPDLKIRLSADAVERVQQAHAYLMNKVSEGDNIYYGINTGFGSLCDTRIPQEDLAQLQVNLIRSHACGTGEFVPRSVIRMMILLKVKSLCFGHSGVHLNTVNRLIDFFNHGITPVIYTQGSLGASGDLAPLAHLSLPLIGEGEVWIGDTRISGAEMHQKMGWEPLSPGPKEGLALLNGTQFMLAYGLYALYNAEKLSAFADTAGALSLDAFDGRPEPFWPELHKIRPHDGQVATAKAILSHLEGSEMSSAPKIHVQDPYSFRCMPQVHGASKDAISYARKVFATEYQSVSDNPNLFPEEDLIVSGGNFHGQPLALALDFLALAISELGAISERRLYLLISGTRGLPAFLTPKPGINSGFMIVQYTAAGIASENKRHCVPASADSIPSSNGQEDHVSMGAHAAVKCNTVVSNVWNILAMEWMAACQALEFRRPSRTSPVLEALVAKFRAEIPRLEEDRYMSQDIQKAQSFLKSL